MGLKCNCGSYAINPGRHGRDADTDLDICDVCYWRKRFAECQTSRDELVTEVNSLRRIIDMNGMVHEAVMHVIRGEPVSDFEQSFADVMDAENVVGRGGDE